MSITLTTVERIGAVVADPAAVAGSGFLYTKLIAGEIQLFYRSDLGTIDQLTPSSGTPSPWQRVANVVDLTVGTDTDVRPTTDNATVLGTSAKRWATVASGPNGHSVFATVAAANPTSLLGSASLAMGPGGATAVDVALARLSAKKFSVTDGAAASGAIVPLTDLDPNGTLGDSTHQWSQAWAQQFVMPGPLVVALPIVAHGYIYASFYPPTGNIELYYKDDSAGPGVRLTPLDGPSGTSPWTRAGGIVNLSDVGDTEVDPTTDNATVLGTSTTRWASVAAGPAGYRVFNLNTDTQPTAAVRNGSFDLGPGVAAATDLSLTRIAGPLFNFNLGARFGGDISRFEAAWTIKTTRTAAGAGNDVTVQGANGVATAANTAFGGGQGTLLSGDSAALGTAQAGGQPASIAAGSAASGATGAAVNGGNVFLATGQGCTAGGAPGTGTSGQVFVQDKGSNGVNLVPPNDQDGSTAFKSGKLGTRDAAHGGTDPVNARWNEVNAVSVISGDMCFTDPCCPICEKEFAEGDDIVLRVIKAEKFEKGYLTRTVPAHHGCK